MRLKNIHKEKETDRNRNIQNEEHTDRETDSETNKKDPHRQINKQTWLS